jgi:hypothetical protein
VHGLLFLPEAVILNHHCEQLYLKKLPSRRPTEPLFQRFGGDTMTTYARLLLAAIAAILAASWAPHSRATSLQSSTAEAITAPPGAAHTGATRRLAAVIGGGAVRDLAAGAAPRVQQVQGTITVTPDTVATGGSATVTLNTSGFFDLSVITEAQIGIRPGTDVSNIQIKSQTAQHLVLSFDIADTAVPGTRTLFITNSQDETVVALDLVFKVGVNVCNPKCVSPKFCRNNVCVSPRPPPPQCNPECDDDHRCVGGRCVDLCQPHCRPPTPFCEGGRCTSRPPQ